MTNKEFGREISKLVRDELERTVVFFCLDKQVSQQIQTQNWKRALIEYEIFYQMEEVIDSFNRKVPDVIVLITNEVISSTYSNVYDELYKQCKLLNIAIFYSLKSYDDELTGNINQFDDILLFPFTVEELLLRLRLHKEQQYSSNDINKNVVGNELYEFTFLPLIYQLYMSTLTRLKKPFTLLFLSFDYKESLEEMNGDLANRLFNMRMIEFILAHVRNSDFVFRMNMYNGLVILFPYSGEVEIQHFLKRVEKNLQPIPLSLNSQWVEVTPKINGSIVEVRNEHAQFTEVINAGIASIKEATKEENNLSIHIVDDYKVRDTELVKVSIIEADSILANIIENLLKNIEIENIELEIATYSDGNQFFETKKHLTSHTHLIIIDDILPKKDGLEVVHELRELPNTNKYMIFMLSTKKTDEDMTYAFHIGVDDYLIKPFNPKMFEARIKRYLSRFR